MPASSKAHSILRLPGTGLHRDSLSLPTHSRPWTALSRALIVSKAAHAAADSFWMRQGCVRVYSVSSHIQRTASRLWQTRSARALHVSKQHRGPVSTPAKKATPLGIRRHTGKAATSVHAKAPRCQGRSWPKASTVKLHSCACQECNVQQSHGHPSSFCTHAPSIDSQAMPAACFHCVSSWDTHVSTALAHASLHHY